MKLRIIVPSTLKGKTRMERGYLLRRHDIDLTELFQAALALWEQTADADTLERHRKIAEHFRFFLHSEEEYHHVLRITRVIDKALTEIQSELGNILDPYIEGWFKNAEVTLSLAAQWGSDIVVEINHAEIQDEPPPPNPDHPPYG